MNRKLRQYAPEFKAMVVAEYFGSDLSFMDLSRKYGVHHAIIGRWTKKHEESEFLSSVNSRNLSSVMSSHQGKSKAELLAYIKELEKSLELSQDKSIALEHFIKNSEKELGVQLPKKPFTNRSKSWMNFTPKVLVIGADRLV